MNTKDWRDYVTYVFAGGIFIAATLYTWAHPSDVNFATWATVCGTLACILKWLDIKDDKERDAQ